jgi:hypothetical protein
MAEGAEGVLERCQVLTRLLRSGSEIRR